MIRIYRFPRAITYFFVFIILQFYFINISMAKKCNVDPKGWIDINISSFNPSKITRDTPISFSIFIANITDMNIEIPVRWIQINTVSVKFINLNQPEKTLIVNGNPPRNDKNDYIVSEPFTSIIFTKDGYENAIQKITDGKSANILVIVSFRTYLRYPGVLQPIGTYINGKFEPTYFHCSQEFHFSYK